MFRKAANNMQGGGKGLDEFHHQLTTRHKGYQDSQRENLITVEIAA